MRKTLQDLERLCTVDAALADITARRPAMADIATSYALLQRARQAAREVLPGMSFLGDAPKMTSLVQGQPLLGPLLDSLAQPAPELLERFLAAARVILPAAAQAFPSLAPELAKIAVRFDKPDPGADEGPGLAAELLTAIGPDAENGPRPQTIEDIAKRLKLSAPALHMSATETFLAVLGHEASLLEGLVDQNVWRRGYCPVCGGGPDVGILKEGQEDSEFLIAKAGQLWLHCGQCAALWRFPRLRCVGCGCEDPERMETIVAEDDPRPDVERAHLCQDCHAYGLTVNLVDRTDRVNLEMLPISLLYLDILAQERGFTPLAPSPWNTLG
ncbi:MAG: formate dehydrogenase accessory protein FdhE [Humidesulfovibrio sp.]|nr:formate dehydrogenase accessory protein FdhE [Humidesulfovibrio sp.]